MLGPSEIRRLIPHDGAMCLLDHVLAWDADTITCRTRSHRAADHPLAHAGRIGALCGIEYGLQAMAVHGALSADRRQPIHDLAGLVSGAIINCDDLQVRVRLRQ